ncbi:hypothetical protein A3C91_01860 [Candidatus Azambacteria bacterium RIFCSPHIGHO2_02_FULL_52_12]|nr:MAG: hypothetical protein A3C91_01860 [Candidatus Azambacteria bacterium RIFCSPHIGHO2_02_FULL_52_12]
MRRFSNAIAVTPHGIARVTWALVACGMVLYFSYHVWTLFRPPFLVLEQNHDIITQEDFVFVRGVTQKESHVFINSREAAVTAKGAFEERIALENGMNAIEIKSVNKFGKTTSVLRRIIKQAPEWYGDPAQIPK